MLNQKEPKRISLRINSEHFLDVPIGTRLIIELEGLDGKFKSVLLGIESGKYLIMRIPVISGIRRKLYEGNQIIVRFECFGVIYGFKSSLLAYVIKGPIQVVFVSYPKAIEVLEMRESQRVNCFLPSRIEINDQAFKSDSTEHGIVDYKVFKGVILDISYSGCRFSTELSSRKEISMIPIGGVVALYFQLPGESKSQTLMGYVRNVHKDSRKIEIGIEFDKANTEILEKIHNYIKGVVNYL